MIPIGLSRNIRIAGDDDDTDLNMSITEFEYCRHHTTRAICFGVMLTPEEIARREKEERARKLSDKNWELYP